MMACFDSVSAQPLERGLEKSPYIRRTLASPIFAISSNSPSTILAEALSASIRTASRGERVSEGTVATPHETECCAGGRRCLITLAVIDVSKWLLNLKHTRRPLRPEAL